MVKQLYLMMVVFGLLSLFFSHAARAQPDAPHKMKHIINVWVNGGVLQPMQITETNGHTLRPRHTWSAELGFSYAYKLYKNFSVGLGAGIDAYSFRYYADIETDGVILRKDDFNLRHTMSTYTSFVSAFLRHDFTMSKKRFFAEIGIEFIQTPSLLSGFAYGTQDVNGGSGANFFEAEILFEVQEFPVYYLRLGTPVWKLNGRSRLSACIAFNYCPHIIGNGDFFVRYSTQNSIGTLGVRATGAGIELRYRF